MNLNEWAHEIHDNAVDHGWWDAQKELPEVLMLIVSELSEALEEDRAGREMVWYDGDSGKPEGIAVEVADALIRILDWFGSERLDVEQIVRMKHDYNKTRPYRHGKKY